MGDRAAGVHCPQQQHRRSRQQLITHHQQRGRQALIVMQVMNMWEVCLSTVPCGLALRYLRKSFPWLCSKQCLDGAKGWISQLVGMCCVVISH